MARPYNMPDSALTGTMYDTENPDSLISIVPSRVVPVLHRIRPKMPRVLFVTEGELRDYVKPDERDERIRLGFWDEYNHSTASKKKMSLSAFIHGIMSWETWVTVFEPNDKKMMWVFCPPVSYQVAMRNILHKGTERLMEIMSLPIMDSDGKPDSKVIVNILRAFQLVDIRVKGAVTQKLQIQQQTHNINQTINAPGVHMSGMPVETLQLEELEKLERRIDRARRDSRRLVSSLDEADREQFIEDYGSEAGSIRGAPSHAPRLMNENLDAEIVLPGISLDEQ